MSSKRNKVATAPKKHTSSRSSEEKFEKFPVKTPCLSESFQKGKQPHRKMSSSSGSDEIHNSPHPSTSHSPPSFQKGKQSSSSNLEESSSNTRKSNSIKSTKKADPKPGTSKETDASTVKKKKKRQVEYVTFANKTFKVSRKIAAEVRELRHTTHNLIPKLPFSRLTREILMACGFTRDHRITGEALDALQTSSEMHIVEVFEDAMLLAMHARRITCMPSDIALVRELRRKRGSICFKPRRAQLCMQPNIRGLIINHTLGVIGCICHCALLSLKLLYNSDFQ